MDDGTPISYQVLARDTPVRTRDGHVFATVDHVLAIPEGDLFDGIVVNTGEGIRFVDRDKILTLTDQAVTCDLDDGQAATLPGPSGSPVYSVDELEYTGGSLPDALGRLFHRPKWHLDED